MSVLKTVVKTNPGGADRAAGHGGPRLRLPRPEDPGTALDILPYCCMDCADIPGRRLFLHLSVWGDGGHPAGAAVLQAARGAQPGGDQHCGQVLQSVLASTPSLLQLHIAGDSLRGSHQRRARDRRGQHQGGGSSRNTICCYTVYLPPIFCAGVHQSVCCAGDVRVGAERGPDLPAGAVSCSDQCTVAPGAAPAPRDPGRTEGSPPPHQTGRHHSHHTAQHWPHLLIS